MNNKTNDLVGFKIYSKGRRVYFHCECPKKPGFNIERILFEELPENAEYVSHRHKKILSLISYCECNGDSLPLKIKFFDIFRKILLAYQKQE